MPQSDRPAPSTLPPGPADDAALEHGRKLAEERDRSSHWWASLERLAKELGVMR
jgi:hypothetical protein